MDAISGIVTAFTQGGVWMFAILGVHIVAIALILERVVALYFNRKPDQKAVARTFEQDIKKGDLVNVINNAKRVKLSHPVATVIQAGAQASIDMGGREEIQARMDEVLLSETAKLEQRTGFLAMLANVGTLLGLLGTVVGLIQSFASVSDLNPVEKAQKLTSGIALAMNTTAYGLIMAIPTLIMFAILTNRSQQLIEDLNQGALKVFNLLIFNNESVPRSTPKKKSAE